MGEYQIKLEAIEEYMNALHYRKLNEELTESLLGLLTQLTKHYERAGMKVPGDVVRITAKTNEVIDARIAAGKMAVSPSIKRKDSLEI